MKRHHAASLALVCSLTSAVIAGNHEAIIDWSRWDASLRAHVVEGRVHYDAFRSDPGFDATVAAIAAADVAGEDHAAVLAFYINTYNVLAVKGILDGHSPESGFGKLRFFFRDKYTVAGEQLTLNALEHNKIRTLGEARIHFAIVCASASCPPLRNEAYLPARLDRQLEDNTKLFINDTNKNRFDVDNGRAHISKIFKWFADDFEETTGSVQAYLAEYVEDARVAEALRRGELKVKYLSYDWSLNGPIDTE